MELLKRE